MRSGLRKRVRTARGALPAPIGALLGDRRAQMERLFALHGRNVERPKTVLFWVPGGMSLMLHVEGAIASALKLRGLNVHGVICDGPFIACARREIQDGMAMSEWASVCPSCRAGTSQVLHDLAIPFSFIGDLVDRQSLRDARVHASEMFSRPGISSLPHQPADLANNVRSAIIRYLQGESLEGREEVVDEYAFSASVVARAAEEAIDAYQPDIIFMSHGIYADWGPAMKVAVRRGIPVVGWMASYLKGHFYFHHIRDSRNVDMHSMSEQAWSVRSSSPLSPDERARLHRFLEDRYLQSRSFDLKVMRRYEGSAHVVQTKLGLTGTRPIWSVMAHVNWDAVADSTPMIYPTLDEWLLSTVHLLVQIPGVDWVIKVHPSEAWHNPASGVQRLIETNFPNLPSNIRVASADVDINPLDFFQGVDGAITCSGTSGLEMALHRKPVILAGEAHYARKGFTYEAGNEFEYKELLEKAGTLPPLTDAQHALAEQYAYSYFVQRQIPLPPVLDPEDEWWHFQYDKRDLLRPGRDPFVDLICDRILDGQDFVMDEELVRSAGKVAAR